MIYSQTQFGGPLWSRPQSELPAHLQTGLGGSEEPEQLRMFMTAQEIMDEFQPLDGDRRSIDEMEDLPASKQYTRSAPESGVVKYPVERRVNGGEGREAWGNTTGGSVFERSKGGTAKKLVNTREETDQELWERKLKETKMSPKEYDKEHHTYAKNMPEMSDVSFGNSMPVRAKHEGTFTFEEREQSYYDGKEMEQDARFEAKMEAYKDPKNSLFNRIESDKVVNNPIALNDPGNYRRFGDSGKPQIANGHHRLAAQHALNPDQYMPVLYWAGGTNEAKKNPHYKYT